MSFFGGVWHGLDEAFFMFWETLWALVLGVRAVGRGAGVRVPRGDAQGPG